MSEIPAAHDPGFDTRPFYERWAGRFAMIACAAMAILFMVISYSAVVNKSATYDENLHVVGGFMHRFFHDYRINPEDPALFGLWSAMPHGQLTLYVDTESDSYKKSAEDLGNQWGFVFQSLYRTKGNDAIAIINASRFQFVMIGVLLCAAISIWSWRLGGATAALVATTLFAFDPNFMAHAAIVKNDVPMALLMLLFAAAVWRMGRCATIVNILIAALMCGAAVNMKFSGLLFGPMMFVLLIVRAVRRESWRVVGLSLDTIGQRVTAAFAICAFTLIVVWGFTWAVYGFRFGTLSNGGLADLNRWVDISRQKELIAQGLKTNPDLPGITKEQFDQHPASLLPRVVVAMNSAHALPQPWLYGFLYTYATTLVRGTYLMGKLSGIGWWYYFPMTILFKTPMATLFAFAIAFLGIVARLASPKLAFWDRGISRINRTIDSWTITVLCVPPLLYLLAAMTQNLNLGLRHILPIFPFCFIGVGLIAPYVRNIWPRASLILGGVLALTLAIETLSRFPNYIAFFNVASGGPRGGYKLLADSNLDWGQDLPLLAEWQSTHTDRPLFISYFGMADPGYFGINGGAMLGCPPFFTQQPPDKVDVHCYMAISATNLLGLYIETEKYKPFATLRSMKPIAVLGGTIYIFEWK